MYGIFAQSSRGMYWCAMADSAEAAQKQIESGDFDRDDVDFIFAIPGVIAFRDLDGTRDSPIGPPTLHE